MARKIDKPSIIKAAGAGEKIIEEYIGRVNTKNQALSIARMISPQGWHEPAQTPEFSEYTVVLKGCLTVELYDRKLKVEAGQAIEIPAGEIVKYSTPDEGGAEYIAVCLPAFSPDIVHRDE
ncbi:MAG: hypothetical protein JW874_08590 [Spirochaetales bacterium]|nr:hypothetical protein [Spirochaetales bacterium]